MAAPAGQPQRSTGRFLAISAGLRQRHEVKGGALCEQQPDSVA